MKIVTGTSGWQYKEWRGSLYPEKMKEADMLGFYATRLSAVEVNYTFRRIPEANVFERWRQQVPEGFQFILKMPQQVTHYKRLRDAGADVERLVGSAATLGDQLGPLLVQLPPTMRLDQARLEEFLAAVPAGARLAFEFRHESWFTDPVFATLHTHNAALCLAETDDEAAPRVATADWGYLRLRRAEYDDAALAAWLDWIREQTWGDAAVFFKHENEARGPRFALRFRELTVDDPSH
jgi:uncharacterized protein YecE (DUF72 family)